jgi:glycosyltransferase involved in cell wall biosynthesis
MHIGFDISQTGSGKAGCGYFAHAMIQAMLELAPEHRYLLFPIFGDFYYDIQTRCSYSGRHVYHGPIHHSRQSASSFWTGNGLEDALGKPEIIHANNFWCPVQLVSSRLVYTLYDMNLTVHPEWTTETNRVGCFEGVFRSSIAADWVVAISEASRKHYLSIFPHFPEERSRVIYPCSRFTDSTLEGKKPKALTDVPTRGYWLSVGTIEPRKNQLRLAKAYARYLALGGAPMPLVFAGGVGWLMDDFDNDFSKLNIAEKVIMTGYVSDDELIWLYRNCYANLYPSLFEGFGLPVLEGMQFGAPTVTSRSTSIPEIAGEAAILLDPLDIEGWAQVMLRLAANGVERDDLSASGRMQAGRFDWKRSALSLLQLYEEALSSPKRSMMRE